MGKTLEENLLKKSEILEPVVKVLKEEKSKKFIKLKLLMIKNLKLLLKNSESNHSKELMKLICLKMIKLLCISKDQKSWLLYKIIHLLLLENLKLKLLKIFYLIFYNILDQNNLIS